MTYDRPWKSFQDQLGILEQRGVLVNDRSMALAWLERAGYYRLSAYSYPFRKVQVEQSSGGAPGPITRLDQFEDHTSFDDFIALYLFDKQLRLLALEGLESVEVALRVKLAYVLGRRHTFAHHEATSFHPTFALRVNNRTGTTVFDEWRRKYDVLLQRSKEEFVAHYRAKYGPDLPIWVACEVWDFGAVSQLYSMMRIQDKEEVASAYGVEDWKVFRSWLRGLNYLRNLCAHHCRLWNRNIVDQPSFNGRGLPGWCGYFAVDASMQTRAFALLAVLRHMLEAIASDSGWKQRIADQLCAFPDQESSRKLDLSEMGVEKGWEEWW